MASLNYTIKLHNRQGGADGLLGILAGFYDFNLTDCSWDGSPYDERDWETFKSGRRGSRKRGRWVMRRLSFPSTSNSPQVAP